MVVVSYLIVRIIFYALCFKFLKCKEIVFGLCYDDDCMMSMY